MLDSQVLSTFRQGLINLEQVRDFASMRDIITRMVSFVSAEELPYANDAIARIIRIKQSAELQEVQGYPHAIQELDKKYQDLYLVLKNAKSKKSESSITKQVTNGIIDSYGDTQNPLGNLVLNWIKSNKGNLVKGSAVVGTLGGAYWLYKFLTTEAQNKLTDADTSFDKTIKSIQKYKTFSQMMKNPDMSNVEEFFSGKPSAKKKRVDRKIEKRQPVEKDQEWDTDERSLMKDMDEAFGALSFRPNLGYKVPQLSTAKPAKASDVLKIKESAPEKKEKRRLDKTDKPLVLSSEKDSSPRELREVKDTETQGRLIPVIRRTKRIRKITV